MVALHPNVDEVWCFEFVDWANRALSYKEVGQFWYREHEHSFFSGRIELKDDSDIPKFLFSRETYEWYHLYIVHDAVKSKVTRYVPNGVYTDSEPEGGPHWVAL